MSLPAVPPGAPAQPAMEPLPASQNLFEHMAVNGQGLAPGSSPAQIGGDLLHRLDGFIERSRSYADSSRVAPTGEPIATGPSQAPAAPRVGDGQMAQLASALTRTFDYAIETQMVVRGATQISGSANTLLRGQ